MVYLNWGFFYNFFITHNNYKCLGLRSQDASTLSYWGELSARASVCNDMIKVDRIIFSLERTILRQ